MVTIYHHDTWEAALARNPQLGINNDSGEEGAIYIYMPSDRNRDSYVPDIINLYNAQGQQVTISNSKPIDICNGYNPQYHNYRCPGHN